MTESAQFVLSQDTRLVRRPLVLSTEVEGQVVMMDMEGGRYFSLDDVGTDIWHQLATPMTFGQLVHSLSATYAAQRHIIERDVAPLLVEMARHGLIDFD